MGAIYLLTLRQLTGRWRLVIMTALAALPVIVAVLAVRSRRAPSVEEFEMIAFNTMLAGSIAPLVVLAIAAAAFANEIEDRTLANLTLSPVPRWRIVVPKLAAAISIAAPFVVVSALITAHVAFLGDATAVAAVTIAAFVAVALYSSTFLWLGLVTTHAIGLGLLYIVLWEGLFAGFVSGVRLLSIRHYSIALMHILDERRFTGVEHPATAAVIGIVVLVFAGFVWLSVRRLRRMDVP